ncbi:hypothetical protein MSAN_00305900 [Mycena sanguinolenta]|uniref:DUF5648 domain-containing protein n=1 Tax=Mycena sanguinolenta TaxID=230812 RepID=A0A8H7DK53_9AGAR|nr:hypothetical protein MSAN_00305900 [Mycena sanguinolenta]
MKHILPSILLSILVGLAAAMNNLHAAGRSAETCGDPDDALAWYRVGLVSQFAYGYSTDVTWVSSVIRNNEYSLQTIMGMVFLTQEESTVPCYFLESVPLVDNFVTINATERDAAIASGQYVLVPSHQTYIYPTEICGSIPMYRLYNSAKTSNFFTTSESERLSAISNSGYADLGIAGYVLPAGGRLLDMQKRFRVFVVLNDGGGSKSKSNLLSDKNPPRRTQVHGLIENHARDWNQIQLTIAARAPVVSTTKAY